MQDLQRLYWQKWNINLIFMFSSVYNKQKLRLVVCFCHLRMSLICLKQEKVVFRVSHVSTGAQSGQNKHGSLMVFDILVVTVEDGVVCNLTVRCH